MATKTYFTKTAQATAAEQPKPRAPKTAAPKTEATKVEVADEVVEPATPFERLHQKVHGAYTEYFETTGVVGPKQRIAAWVCGALVAFGTGYLGGWVSAVLMATVVLATSSLFLGFMIYVLSLIAVIIAGATLGSKVHQLVLDFDAKAIKSRVTGWFNRSNVEAQHA